MRPAEPRSRPRAAPSRASRRRRRRAPTECAPRSRLKLVRASAEAPALVPRLRRMDRSRTPRVELLIPMRTVLLVAAAIAVLAAFVAIGDTFLIVFVGIFLALVLHSPGRFSIW